MLAVIRQESAFRSGGRELRRRARPDAADAGDGEVRRDADRAALHQAAADRRHRLTISRSAAPISTELIEDYGGSYVLAIAAYNAGPRRVAEWIGTVSRSHAARASMWSTGSRCIPISETRNYVQRVLENVQVYRHRIGGTQIAVSIEQDLTR